MTKKNKKYYKNRIMKRIIILLLVIISSTEFIKAQETSDIEIITSGIWYIEYMEYDGVKKKLPVEAKKINWMLFYPNGKGEVLSMGEKSNIEWVYNLKNKSIRIIEKGNPIDFKIEKITKEKIVLSTLEMKIITYLGLTKNKI